MEMLTNAVNWIEIPVTDFDRAKQFYSDIYDFQMPEMEFGPTKMGILLHDQQKNGIGGAIVLGDQKPSRDGAIVYLNGGADLNTVLQRIPNAGGEVLTEKIALGNGLGHVAYFLDTEGNRVGLHSSS